MEESFVTRRLHQQWYFSKTKLTELLQTSTKWLKRLLISLAISIAS